VAAAGFQARQDVRARLAGLRGGLVLGGDGGVGKTQVAAGFAREPGADLVVWVDRADEERVKAAYAAGAHALGLPGAGRGDALDDALLFRDWLAVTDRVWRVVLDDLADPELEQWWPPVDAPAGATVVTTRSPELVPFDVVTVGSYTPDEAVAYFAARLGRSVDGRERELAIALGCLPLHCASAAAYLVGQRSSATSYLARLDDRPPALLALEGADRDTAGLATPVAQLTALLDPDGHPMKLWGMRSVTAYLAAGRPRGRVGSFEIRAALGALEKYALTSLAGWTPRGVRMHDLTGAVVRAHAEDPDGVAHAAADGLLQLWPDDAQVRSPLADSLRANAVALADNAGDRLWSADGGHQLLFRAGNSLISAGMTVTATGYWDRAYDRGARIAGPQHRDTLASLNNLASAFQEGGLLDRAVELQEQVLAGMRRTLGDDHPDTLAVRGNLATALWQAGRADQALELMGRVVTDLEARGGPTAGQVVQARANLAVMLRKAGRLDESVRLLEKAADDARAAFGADHPHTLGVRGNLAISYRHAGRADKAVPLLEKVFADSRRRLGDAHPDTLNAWGSLAAAYAQQGRVGEALAIDERVLAGQQRALGAAHPYTVTARGNLAHTYWLSGRADEAIALLAEVVAQRAAELGEQHPDTTVPAETLRRWRAGQG
jgi:tetratricopeptide (TPR) repeat protein